MSAHAPDDPVAETRLTAFSHGAGCACKLGPDDLSRVLAAVRHRPAAHHPDLVVGIATGDDAGVFRLGDGTLLVQTTDFFTPIVDDAYDWGRVAAANALSDVYAMGGRPLTALQLVAWPREGLSFDLLARVLSGGADVCAVAGCVIAGGHSIDDPEPKFGLAVTGIVEPGRLMTNAAARPGDRLVLSKPLGTGVITTALKRDLASSDEVSAAVESMVALNATAAAVLTDAGVGAATDVTGFGLLGHLGGMLRASGVSACVSVGSLPVLPGVHRLLAEGVFAGGSQRNLVSSSRFTDFGDLGENERKLLADAQTSGGLLAAVDPRRLDQVVAGLVAAGTLAAAVIGEVEAGEPGAIAVRR